MSTGSPDNPLEPSGARPFWVPQNVDFDSLSEEMRAAIVDFVNPTYAELVLAPASGLERSMGLTVVHLLWLEILDQLELAGGLSRGACPTRSEDRGKLIDAHLRLAGAKAKAAAILMRLNDFRERWGHLPGQPAPFQGAD